jgi:bifunctional UDP-N-acetylglucosamine pyrophosphorylase/glucosamine-1-phosphate N-acetyltransferase
MTVILAAGQGKRMKSDLPKVLHPLAGRPMLDYLLDLVEQQDSSGPRLLVLGHDWELVLQSIEGRGWDWVHQKERLGTGHALKTAGHFLKGFRGDVLVLNGDTPLLTGKTVAGLIRLHRQTKGTMTLLAVRQEDPRGYGRILRDDDGRIQAIVEEKELSGRRSPLEEVNGGVYVFEASYLRGGLRRLVRHPRSGEYYLTDLAAAAAARGKPPAALVIDDPEEAMGVNDRRQLALADAAIRRRILDSLMSRGVTVMDPAVTYVDHGVKVGRDTVLLPGVILENGARIGRRCRIGPHARVSGGRIGDGAAVMDGSVIVGSTVDPGAVIGPMAHLEPGERKTFTKRKGK